VADAPNVVGFDPFARLADYLERAARARGRARESAGAALEAPHARGGLAG
jgi:hypothetical protein